MALLSSEQLRTWTARKPAVMEAAMQAKFSQHEALRSVLLAAGRRAMARRGPRSAARTNFGTRDSAPSAARLSSRPAAYLQAATANQDRERIVLGTDPQSFPTSRDAHLVDGEFRSCSATARSAIWSLAPLHARLPCSLHPRHQGWCVGCSMTSQVQIKSGSRETIKN